MLRTAALSSRIIILASLLLCPAVVSADVFISEFSIGGGTGHSDDDYIELYNSGEKPVSLGHWKLRKRTRGSLEKAGTESSIKEFSKEDCIAPEKTFLWVNSKAMLLYKDQANATSTATLTPDNSIALFDEKGVERDAVIFGNGHYQPFLTSTILSNPLSALAHVRDPLSLTWSENLPPTPEGGANDACITKSSASSPIPTVRINEIFPNPDVPQDAGEYIEFFNVGSTPLDISDWKITTTTQDSNIPSDTIIPAGGYRVITDQDFSFALKNTHETLSLIDAGGIVRDTVTYEKSTEGASLNWTENGWRSSKTLTPGQPNILSNTLPSTRERVPKKGYRDIYLDFQARGQDSDGDSLKYSWDFGDGHKSYKENTRHRYDKTGDYVVTLTTKDGNEEISETFTVRIDAFDPPKLRITALVPNPAGRDTDAEWIEIFNHSKKDVDLKGYSIATGTKKKLTNHPIRESFVIPKRSARQLNRTTSFFTLPNERGRIELRSPDGKVIHDLKYTFEKSLADNAVLRKEKGKRIIVSLPTPPPTDISPAPASINSDPSATALPAPEASAEEVSQISPLEILEEQAQRERTARLLALTARGTSIVFSDRIIDSVAPLNKKQEVIPPVSTPSQESTLLHELVLRTNTWINSLSAAPEPMTPPSEPSLPILSEPSLEPRPEPLMIP